MRRIGLISDTHGLLRPQVVAFLQGCHHIVHAGDVGAPGILDQLAAIAPVTAVRGNNDIGAWAQALPETALVRIGDMRLYVLHDLAELRIAPPPPDADVVVSGHSHKPLVSRRDGLLFVNPGSVGPRRFKLPIAAADLFVDGRSVDVQLREFAETGP